MGSWEPMDDGPRCSKSSVVTENQDGKRDCERKVVTRILLVSDLYSVDRRLNVQTHRGIKWSDDEFDFTFPKEPNSGKLELKLMLELS